MNYSSERLREKSRQFERRAVLAESRDSTAKRKLETRRKIVIGAAALSLNDPELLARLMARLAEKDRRLFDVPPDQEGFGSDAR